MSEKPLDCTVVADGLVLSSGVGMMREMLLRPASGRSREYCAALKASRGVTDQPGATKGRARLPSACSREPVGRLGSTFDSGKVKRLYSPSKPHSKPPAPRSRV